MVLCFAKFLFHIGQGQSSFAMSILPAVKKKSKAFFSLLRPEVFRLTRQSFHTALTKGYGHLRFFLHKIKGNNIAHMCLRPIPAGEDGIERAKRPKRITRSKLRKHFFEVRSAIEDELMSLQQVCDYLHKEHKIKISRSEAMKQIRATLPHLTLPKTRSKLDRYSKEILSLRKEGKGYGFIANFLTREFNLNTSPNTVKHWLLARGYL